MLYDEPVTSTDDPSVVWKKIAVAWGAIINPEDDETPVLRKACAALQGTTYPPT